MPSTGGNGRDMAEGDQLYIEDFSIGDRFAGASNPVTEDAFQAFARITGDAHPIHYDEDYARARGFGKRVAHGLLVMGMTALGATPLSARLTESMIAFAGQDCRFRRPVFIGDTLRSEFEVEAVDPRPEKADGRVRFAVRLYNQNNELVLDGHHVYLLRSRGVT